MLPPDECLHPGDRAVLEVDDRLVVEQQLVLAHGLREGALELASVVLASPQVLVEDDDLPATEPTRLGHGGAGVTQQVGGCPAAGRGAAGKDRDPD